MQVPGAEGQGGVGPAAAGGFEGLVDRYAQELYGLAYSMLGNGADAEDALQETFLAAFRGLGRFEGRSSLRTWLTGILVRQVALVRRRGGRRAAAPVVPGDAAVCGGEAGVAAKHDAAALLAALSPEHRDVLVLREMRGMSYKEISEVLGVPRGTVESRLHRARAALRGLVDRGEA